MTGNEIGAGARAHYRGKRRYLMVSAAWVVAVAAVGLALRAAQQGVGPGSLPSTAAIVFAALMSAMIVGGTFTLYRLTDELDMRDNLVALNVGFIANMVIVVAWTMLYFGGLAGRPDAAISLGASAVAVFAAYVWRKLQRR